MAEDTTKALREISDIIETIQNEVEELKLATLTQTEKGLQSLFISLLETLIIYENVNLIKKLHIIKKYKIKEMRCKILDILNDHPFLEENLLVKKTK